MSRWQQRMMELGLDPDRDSAGRPVLKEARGLDEYKRFFAFPVRANAPASTVSADDIARMDDAELEDTIWMHVTNQRVIQDPAIIQAVDGRKGGFEMQVTAQQELVVDGTQYEVTGSVYFSTVTLRNGGSIKIKSAGHFECDDFVREQSGTPSEYDIYYAGATGTGGDKGDDGYDGGDGDKGNGGECTGGLWADHDGSNGSSGKKGGDGGSAKTGGGQGQSFGKTYFTINNSLTGFLSFSNQGGAGGAGGAGGKGGDGGDGGKGGNGKKCEFDTAHGGDGGKGGDGGDGGNGSNGGNGGKGAELWIAVPADAATKITAVNVRASGGALGPRGDGGKGGKGGDAGSHGGSQGKPGANGHAGLDGSTGNPGDYGTIYLNDQFFAGEP